MRRSINHFLLGALSISLFVGSCRKHLPDNDTTGRDMISQARAFLDSFKSTGFAVNYRAAQPKTIRWDLGRLVDVGQVKGIQFPIVYDNVLLMKANFVGDPLFHLDYLTQLLYYKDTGEKGRVLVLTAFPDSNFFKNPTGPFTGIKFIEDWWGHPVEKLLYTTSGQVKLYRPNMPQPDLAEVVQTCYSIVGYNYSPELGETEYWTEPAGCSTNFIDDGSGTDVGSDPGSGSPGSGPGGASGAATVTLLPGNSVIKSIKTYFQCFTNVGGNDHTYTVTVCVDEPDPGTRTPWTTGQNGSSGSSAGNNPVNVGHTFLTLSETYGTTTITRNVGFYPAGDVSPLAISSQGSLNDDETHSYNISGTFTVNDAQFFNVLNFISQGNTPGYLYNLNTNNCTTFVINAAAQAGITLPHTIGTWLDGTGNDPGDLGEDLRTDNIPGMAVNINGGTSNSHLNVGQCN